MATGRRFNMEEEFAGLDFHSIRLEQRFVETMETLAQRPNASIWEASENRAEAKAVCRTLGKEDVGRREIVRARLDMAVRFRRCGMPRG
jgi:hypothetical protein